METKVSLDTLISVKPTTTENTEKKTLEICKITALFWERKGVRRRREQKAKR